MTTKKTGLQAQEVGQDYSDDSDYSGLNSYKTQIILPKTYGGQEAQPAACLLSEWSAWSNIRGFCGLEKLKRNRACVGEREGVCSDLDCGNALYEETKTEELGPCCSWSEWGPWSAPDTECGEARRDRGRSCQCRGYHQEDCPGEREDWQKVVRDPCCEWSAWTQDSPAKTCGSTEAVSRRACLSISGSLCGHCPGTDTISQTLELEQCPVSRVWTHKPRMYAHSTSAHHYTTVRPSYVPAPKSYGHDPSHQSYKLPVIKSYEPKTYGKRRRWRF